MTDGIKKIALLAGVVLLALFIVAITLGFYAGQGCAPEPVEILPVDIDAGPGTRAIEEELDGSIRAAEARIEEIDREHAEAIAAFEGEQARKHEAIRRQGPEALETWFEGLARTLFDGGTR